MLADTERPDYAARLRLADPRAVHRSAVALVTGDVPASGKLLIDFAGPRSFLVGELSLPDADAEEVAKHGIPVLEVPRAGHNLMLDNPDGFAGALARALGDDRSPLVSVRQSP
ncbi:alpha/beta fold hydrolase [Streptomyces sp. NPDC058877]